MGLTMVHVERFHAKYIPEPNSGCWLWDACADGKGYGRFGVDRRPLLAHRVSYEMHIGPIPEGMFVCHKCDVPGCVNPAHLFLGTCADNMADCKSKGRTSRGAKHVAACEATRSKGDQHYLRLAPEKVLRGENHPMARLSAADIAEMRAMRSEGALQREIAEKFRTGRSHISCILRGKKWKS